MERKGKTTVTLAAAMLTSIIFISDAMSTTDYTMYPADVCVGQDDEFDNSDLYLNAGWGYLYNNDADNFADAVCSVGRQKLSGVTTIEAEVDVYMGGCTEVNYDFSCTLYVYSEDEGPTYQSDTDTWDGTGDHEHTMEMSISSPYDYGHVFVHCEVPDKDS